MNDTAKVINLAEMSDEEISNLDPSTLPSKEGKATSSEAQPVTDGAKPDTGIDETGGAASDSDLDDTAGGTGTTSDDGAGATGTATGTADEPSGTAKGDQPPGKTGEAAAVANGATGAIDFESEYSKVMAPLKAAKREIKISSADDARRLMQMGADYSRKMEAMKPYQQVLKTLEKNGLLSMERINFLIDLDKKNPEAIRKFLKDSQIDPMDLRLEEDSTYRPTDHGVSENELALDEVIDSIRATPSFDRTVEVITKQWDTASKRIMAENPRVIQYINGHMENGIYDLIAERVASDRVFGRLNGLSDLEAYKTVGDAMHAEGAFTKLGGAPSAGGNTNMDTSQGSGSAADKEAALRDKRLKAAPPKGGAPGKTKTVPNFLGGMTDAEIEKFDIRSLNP